MRKVMCFLAAVLVAGVAASFAGTSATATTTPQWFKASTQLTLVQPHMLQTDAWLVNVGTIKHTAIVDVQVEGPGIYGGHVGVGPVTLAPGATWHWGIPAGWAPRGTYVVRITATHVFQAGDPGGLAGAKTSASSTLVVP